MRDSTNPASFSTRRCLETEGCERESSCSSSPTERSEASSRLRMARRLGSARMAKEDSTMDIYPSEHIPVKPYYGPKGRGEGEWPLLRLRLGLCLRGLLLVLEAAQVERDGPSPECLEGLR